MRVRSLFSAVVAAALCSVPLGAQRFHYVPDSAAYEARVVTKMSREMGGQRMQDEITQHQRLTVAVAPQSSDTLRIGITIDTAHATSLAGPQDMSQLIGLRVEGRISPTGDVYSSAMIGRNLGPASTMVASELARILPRMRADLRTGLTWTDTTTENVDMLGVPIERRTVTTSAVAGDTMVAGEAAWRVSRKADVRFTGKGAVSGQALTIAGTSTSTGLILLARTGKYLGSTQQDSVTTNFTSNGMEIAMTQTQRTDVSRAGPQR